MRRLIDALIRILVVVVIVLIAIAFPSFDSIMVFMGSCLGFSICIIFPLAFYLKIFEGQISTRERILDWFLIIVCTILAVVGTVFAFLPKDKLGLA